MIKKKIYKKYNHIYIAKGGGIYIGLKNLLKVIDELFFNGYKIYGLDFILVENGKIQPFMEYSIYNSKGYKISDLLEYLKKNKFLFYKKFDVNNIFFDIITD